MCVFIHSLNRIYIYVFKSFLLFNFIVQFVITIIYWYYSRYGKSDINLFLIQ